MDRRRIAAGVIGVVVATSVLGFIAGSRITSPAEVASRTAPPEASLILAPVEERVLSTSVVTRGTGRFGSPQKLSVATSALKPTPGLIAELPVAGAQLGEGDVAVSASGRPLFLLVGVRPMSRDLGPGLTGDDVRQLEEALVRLGFDPGPVDGVYDAQTEAGVTAWYSAKGFAPFTATVDQLAAVRTREAELATASVDVIAAADGVSTAQAALASAKAAAATARSKADAAQRAVNRAHAETAAANASAATDVAAKQAALDTLRSGKPTTKGTPAEIAVAQADLTAARANQTAVAATGARSVAEAQAALDAAPARLSAAIDAAHAADGAAAADVAAKQAALDAVLADPTSTEKQVASATADVAAARATAENIRVTGVQSVAAAQAVLDGAPAALDAARTQAANADAVAAGDVAAKQATLNSLTSTTPPTVAEIAAAERDLDVAKSNAESVRLAGERSEDDATTAATDSAADADLKAAEVSSAETVVANSKLTADSRSSSVDRATLEADLARRRAGVQVPADEIVFVASAPVHLSDLLVGLGDLAIGGMMKVTDSVVHVDGGLAVADAALVKPDMVVQISEPELGIATTGTVKTVAPSPGTNGVDGFHVYIEVTVESPPANLVGASVRLTIPVQSSGGPVLAVPISALTLAADGSSRLQRSVHGATEFVPVTAGLSADGFVAVTDKGAALKQGDLVVIGFGPQSAGTASTGPPDSVAPSSVPTSAGSAPGASGG